MLCFSPFKRYVLPFIFLVGSLGASPSQYYAQIYTEILGRSPDPSEWVAHEYQFMESSIRVDSARDIITSFLQSSEFRNLGYTPAETAYLVYRVTLLREPSTAEMAGVANRLSSGVSAADVARDIMTSAEFSTLLNLKIRATQAHSYVVSNPSPRTAVGTVGLGSDDGEISGDELQAHLNAAAPGTVVYLARGVLVRAFNTIEIPAGVTLTTYEASAANNIFSKREAYAAMGRIVRSVMFSAPLVRVMPGAKIIGVWVDGRRSQLRVNDPVLKFPTLSAAERFQFSHNVSVFGGADGNQISEVTRCKLSDSTGWTSLHGLGSDGGSAIGVATFADNMITSYSANKDLEESFFTDGISNSSSHATIINNDIVDPTDVGIVVFNPSLAVLPQIPQCSQVSGNSILFAGVDGWGGITLDHSVGIEAFCQGVNPAAPYNCFDSGNSAITASFDNTQVYNNQIWSSDDHYANVGISLGVQLWGLRLFGTGAKVLGNQIGTERQPFNTGAGIVITGMKEPFVIENNLYLNLDQSVISCHSTPLLLDPTKTTLSPAARIDGNLVSGQQSNFVQGETWGMLRSKSNGYVSGNYNLFPAFEGPRVITVETLTSSLRIQELNFSEATEDWVILHSIRNFGDNQIYYLIKNRGTHQVIQANDADATIQLAPFNGSEAQYWRMEAFDGVTPGNGVRLVNRVTGQYLARDASGLVYASSTPSNPLEVGWKFRKIENRALDLSQLELMVVDPFGEIFQVYTNSAFISEDRSVGNPSATLGIGLFAADNATAKPLGMFDLNGDNHKDVAFVLDDRSLSVCPQSSSGFVDRIDLGNPNKWLSPAPDSWEKPVGFMNVGGSQTEDLILIDFYGGFEAIYINPDGLAGGVQLGTSAEVGLPGLTSEASSPFKPVGSGDFNGDGNRELLFVGPAGGLFRVSASNGTLSQAILMANPVADFGWGFTSDPNCPFKPVAIADINGDGIDDIIMVEGSGYLYAYVVSNNTVVGGANLGSPQKSWGWNFNIHSTYSRPLSIPFGTGWWRW